MNRYLARRREKMMMRDGRNPYGAKEGYVDSRQGRDYRGDYNSEYDNRRDYGSGMGRMDSRDYMGDQHSREPRGRMEFYGYGVASPDHRGDYNDYRNDYNDYRGDYNDYRGGDYNDMRRDYRGGYRGDYRGMDGHNYRGMNYEMMEDHRRGRRDYNDYGDYRRDYRGDYNDYSGDEQDYKKKLKEWEEKLKKHDKYGMTKSQVTEQARSYGAKFQEYDEEEFYVAYLMKIAENKELFNDPMVFIKMAKAFLEDKDSETKGSEKLCAYMYEIALGGK